MSSSQFTFGITMLATGGTLVFLKKGLLFGSFLLVVGPSFASEKATKLKVNRHSRSDVVAFWHRYYQASEGYAVSYTQSPSPRDRTRSRMPSSA